VAPARAPESNIEIIFADWLDAMRRGDLETMAGRLAPDVVHQGVRPELICRNREQVITWSAAGLVECRRSRRSN
jgi:ketosteroid isomerase-like protein